jgi:GNAT superfamily N-acetyltransferase
MSGATEQARAFRADATLRDGRPITIRAIRPDDKAALEDAFNHLRQESVYFRFFSAKRHLSARELAYFTELDFDEHVGLVAVDGERLAGIGRYIVLDDAPHAAALAFTVADDYHGLGIATLLLHHLADIARAAGLRELRATVLAENAKMLEVLEHAHLPLRRRSDGGIVEMTLSLGE